MIEPTDEMERAAQQAADENWVGLHRQAARDVVAAVLAIVERDYGMVGPCSAALPHLVDPEYGTFCDLRHGHTGDHESGSTRWRELP